MKEGRNRDAQLRHTAGPQLHGFESPLGVLELTFLGLFLPREKGVMCAGCLSCFYKYS